MGLVLVSVAELRTPATRGLDAERLRSLLRGIAAGAALPVFREPDAVLVLNGMHRVAIARVAGFTHIPCLTVSLDEARDFYRYPEGSSPRIVPRPLDTPGSWGSNSADLPVPRTRQGVGLVTATDRQYSELSLV